MGPHHCVACRHPTVHGLPACTTWPASMHDMGGAWECFADAVGWRSGMGPMHNVHLGWHRGLPRGAQGSVGQGCDTG